MSKFFGVLFQLFSTFFIPFFSKRTSKIREDDGVRNKTQ